MNYEVITKLSIFFLYYVTMVFMFNIFGIEYAIIFGLATLIMNSGD